MVQHKQEQNQKVEMSVYNVSMVHNTQHSLNIKNAQVDEAFYRGGSWKVLVKEGASRKEAKVRKSWMMILTIEIMKEIV